MNLPELIAAHRGGRSNPELAKDCGAVFSDKRMQQLSTGAFKEFPEPRTVIALARGLRVSDTAVLFAVGESLGLDVSRPMPPLLELLPAAVSDLPDNQVRAIAALIYEFTEGARQKEGPGNGNLPAKKRGGRGGPHVDIAEGVQGEDLSASEPQSSPANETTRAPRPDH